MTIFWGRTPCIQQGTMKVSICWMISENITCLILTLLSRPWKHISFFKRPLIRGKERREKSRLASAGSPGDFFPARGQDGHIVSRNKSTGWHGDEPVSAAFGCTELLRSRVAACEQPAGRLGRVRSTAVWRLCHFVFWLKQNIIFFKTRSVDYFMPSFLTKCSPSPVLSNLFKLLLNIPAEPYFDTNGSPYMKWHDTYCRWIYSFIFFLWVKIHSLNV